MSPRLPAHGITVDLVMLLNGVYLLKFVLFKINFLLHGLLLNFRSNRVGSLSNWWHIAHLSKLQCDQFQGGANSYWKWHSWEPYKRHIYIVNCIVSTKSAQLKCITKMHQSDILWSTGNAPVPPMAWDHECDGFGSAPLSRSCLSECLFVTDSHPLNNPLTKLKKRMNSYLL